MVAKGEPAVSIIMNCLNGEKFVRKAIESVYAQTFQDWEIIFLDNASTDRTAEIAHSYDQRLRYFRNPVTVPLGRARNDALAKVEREFVAFLDVDDFWLPHKLEKQMPLFANPATGLVFSDAYMRFGEGEATTTYFRRYRYRPPRGRIFGSMLEQYAIPMLTAVVRVSLLQRLNHAFDDRYQVCDDFDFFMRLVYECECDYVDEPLASCLLHPEGTWSKLQRLSPQEIRMTLDKLRARYPEIERDYGASLSRRYEDLAHKEAIVHWQAGNDAEARKALKPFLHSKKSKLLYLATLLPVVARPRMYWLARRSLYRAATLLR